MAEPSDTFADDLPSIKSQRRFLETMSLICAAYYWFKPTLNPRSALGSFPVHVGSTHYVIPALWIGLVWSAWRYGQQLYRAKDEIAKTVQLDYRIEFSRVAFRVVRGYVLGEDGGRFGDGLPEFKGNAAPERFRLDRARRFNAANEEVDPHLPDGLGAESHTVIHTTFDLMSGDVGKQIDHELGIKSGRLLLALLAGMDVHLAATSSNPRLHHASNSFHFRSVLAGAGDDGRALDPGLRLMAR